MYYHMFSQRALQSYDPLSDCSDGEQTCEVYKICFKVKKDKVKILIPPRHWRQRQTNDHSS